MLKICIVRSSYLQCLQLTHTSLFSNYHSTIFWKKLKTQDTVVFDEIALNEGNAYNKTSGIFTTPFDGLYSFTLTLSKGGKLFITEIVKNGHPISCNYNDGRCRDWYPKSSSHFNIKIKSGDKVLIRTHSRLGQYAYGGNWGNFSGTTL